MKAEPMQSRCEPRRLSVERAEGILSIVLNNPPLNILTTEVLEELEEALAAGADGAVRALLISGAGRGFCAGASVEEHFPGKVEAMLARFRAVLEHLCSFPAPTIAALHGVALGGGLELACAADVIVAGEGTKIGQPEIRLGAIAPAALVFLPRRIGYHRAADLLFSGRQIAAAEARAIGLADFVYPDSQVLAEARKYVQVIASHSGAILREYKRALLQVSASGRRPLQEMEDLYLTRVASQPDYLEGLKAFLEKRQPQWQHLEKGKS